MTKPRNLALVDPALKRAAAAVGGWANLADLLHVAGSSVYNWKRSPPHRVLAIERISGVTRYELRPDLYPMEMAPAAVRARLLKAKGKKSVAKPAKTGKSGRARAA
jgi:DNA-binding transcriptional regulator YdaS (Cro superfamily)